MIEAIPLDQAIGIWNRALLVLGWAGTFRRSKIVNINIEDVVFTRDDLLIHLSRSKTDQKGESQEVALPF
jgi:hypothetical protein